MAVVSELIRTEGNGSVSFGDYSQTEKKKLESGAYKVKTFQEITRLEKNGEFVYESTPGTAVLSLAETADGVTFSVEGPEDADITVGLAAETEYQVSLDGEAIGTLKTNLGGKLTFSVELDADKPVAVEVKKA